jgi:hypothetical protein
LSPLAAFKDKKINFLHSIPGDLDREFNLSATLNACADVKGDGTLQRLEIVNALINVFKQIERDRK